MCAIEDLADFTRVDTRLLYFFRGCWLGFWRPGPVEPASKVFQVAEYGFGTHRPAMTDSLNTQLSKILFDFWRLHNRRNFRHSGYLGKMVNLRDFLLSG